MKRFMDRQRDFHFRWVIQVKINIWKTNSVLIHKFFPHHHLLSLWGEVCGHRPGYTVFREVTLPG